MRPKHLALVVPVVLLALPCTLGAQAPAKAPPTFSKDIAPILQRSCQGCHNPGGIGPMSLMTFDQVRPWARAIKLKTSQREMPPWFVEKRIGIQRFKDDTSLTDQEIDTIVRWTDGGAAQGNPADLPPAPVRQDASAWSIGTPDLVVSSPVLDINPVAADFMKDVGPAATELAEDRYIQAIEVREVSRGKSGSSAGGAPLNYFLVHHATITVADDRPGEPAEPQPDEGGGGRRLMFYQMGQNATVYPADVGALLPAGSALKFGIHVHSVGEAMPLRLDVAFKFYPKGVTPKYVLSSFSTSPRFQHEDKVYPDPSGNSPWTPGWTAPPVAEGGRYPVTATFSTRGEYVVRVMAHDGGLSTTADVRVSVE